MCTKLSIRSAIYIQDLKDLKEQSLGPVDPSIQFFGLEWTSVFSRLYSLGVEIRCETKTIGYNQYAIGSKSDEMRRK